MNCRLSWKHGNFFLVERSSASERGICSLRLGCDYSKITFRVLCWQFCCFLLRHSKRFPHSSQGSSTWSRIRTIKHKIMLLTCKIGLTKWWFTHRTLFISLVRMLRNFPLTLPGDGPWTCYFDSVICVHSNFSRSITLLQLRDIIFTSEADIVTVSHATLDAADGPKRRFAFCSDPPSVQASFIDAFN